MRPVAHSGLGVPQATWSWWVAPLEYAICLRGLPRVLLCSNQYLSDCPNNDAFLRFLGQNSSKRLMMGPHSYCNFNSWGKLVFFKTWDFWGECSKPNHTPPIISGDARGVGFGLLHYLMLPNKQEKAAHHVRPWKNVDFRTTLGPLKEMNT